MENILPRNRLSKPSSFFFSTKIHNKAVSPDLELELYNGSNKLYFEKFNREWVEKYFEVEPIDELYFKNPKELIIDKGGEVFFVKHKGEYIGTCAMLKKGNSYELAKMGVTESSRGLGAGQFLMDVAIEWAHEQGAEKVFLITNSQLGPANSLYLKNGFVITHQGPHPDYKRADRIFEKAL